MTERPEPLMDFRAKQTPIRWFDTAQLDPHTIERLLRRPCPTIITVPIGALAVIGEVWFAPFDIREFGL